MESSNNLKFYTPDISEFRVGFICEFKNPMQKNIWEQHIMDQDLVAIAYDSFEHSDEFAEEFRVKYLDSSDIESLGFIEIGQEEYFLNGDINNWCIEKLYHADIKSYYRINTYDNLQIMFLEIKNKSQLQTLLKQLDIQ